MGVELWGDWSEEAAVRTSVQGRWGLSQVRPKEGAGVRIQV